MHFRLMYPTDFLCAADLRGKDVSLTIAKLVREELRAEDGDQEGAWVVHFEEMEKRPKEQRKKWVLNKTCAKVVAKLHGTETDAWSGKKVTLYPTTCMAFGERVECIRVREGGK